MVKLSILRKTTIVSEFLHATKAVVVYVIKRHIRKPDFQFVVYFIACEIPNISLQTKTTIKAWES